jgi:predicted  nucleic acid-binding Zn-ribbon protein
MTQKEVLDALLTEIKHIKTHMPNGELKQMQKDMEELKEDISEIKHTMLNPETGVVVNTNKNTDFRNKMELGDKEFRSQMMELEDVKRWRNGVNKALWIIFGSIVAIVIRIIIISSESGKL